MGKHLWREPANQQFEDNHPGCMWGILHVLDYHHWNYNVKKTRPHKKLNGPRYDKGNVRHKTRLYLADSDEMQKLVDAETDPSSRKTSSTNKRSLRERIKALISKEMSKEESHGQRGSGLPRSQLQRTYSIHHLEPSDQEPHGKNTGWNRPIIFLPANAESNAGVTRSRDQGHMNGTKSPVGSNDNFVADDIDNVLDCLDKELTENLKLNSEKCEKAKEISENQKHMETSQHRGNASNDESADVLEIFRVNKELFLKVMQETDDGIAKCYHNLPAARLIKSGSFPAANFSHNRKFRPSTPRHKQNEVWSSLKGEKFAGTQAPKLVAFKSLRDPETISQLLMVVEKGGKVQTHDLPFYLKYPTEELDERGNNKVPLNPLCQKTEYAVGEHEDKLNSFHEIGGSVYDLSKDKPTHIRRTSSLNESLERYAQLFQNSFNREVKLHVSKSLKLTNESEILSGDAPKSFKRVRSLTHLDSYPSVPNELSSDAHFSGVPIRTVVDGTEHVASDSHDETKPVNLPINAEHVPAEANKESECLYDTVETSSSSQEKEHLSSLIEHINQPGTAKVLELGEEMEKQTVREGNFVEEREIAINNLPRARPTSVVRSCSQEDVTRCADFSTSEGSEGRGDYVDKEPSVDSRCTSGSDTLASSNGTGKPENFQNASMSVKNERLIELCTNDNTDFDFVHAILEHSGFNGNSFLGTWHSLDQPLSPLVFEEVKACWPHESQCSGEETYTCCHHQLMFDLINEVLLQIRDSSFTYYPKELSFSCRLRPMPVNLRHHILEEVWGRISKIRSLRLGMDQSVDCAIVQDLGRDDGWMNLQMETECVALELEDMILDELLEEIICS
ncbi:uncharacterized protein LOC127798990 [Diospyros lotus]|uniref:uncharacterized protein LOC127798990 n=1 Tax=Diospyros lotus TaxID=55363 RepID=UPI002251169A|nr:uncharacterized protein LOC127798990 [Diospyros lotus]XP_052188627.1 uncharacterized protein LOC127798990 [Diospyros lotus]